MAAHPCAAGCSALLQSILDALAVIARTPAACAVAPTMLDDGWSMPKAGDAQALAKGTHLDVYDIESVLGTKSPISGSDSSEETIWG